jgi:hypothetical protein
MATSTPSNGLDTANQKETSQPESFAVLFVFTLFSQAFEDRHFTEREISFETLNEVRTHLINREWVRSVLVGRWQGATKEHSQRVLQLRSNAASGPPELSPRGC